MQQRRDTSADAGCPHDDRCAWHAGRDGLGRNTRSNAHRIGRTGHHRTWRRNPRNTRHAWVPDRDAERISELDSRLPDRDVDRVDHAHRDSNEHRDQHRSTRLPDDHSDDDSDDDPHHDSDVPEEVSVRVVDVEGSYARRIALGASLALLALTPSAEAYPHVVQPGETLAQIAERAYGLIDLERVLVAANGLDAGGGISITPGMRIEIPALSHRRVNAGDTWAGLAASLLGDPERADVLAAANDSNGWMPPAEGSEIVIPYNLRVVVGPNDSLVGIAQRFLAVKEKAWMLDRYNHLKGEPPKKGDVILVPLSTLKLSDRGREDALTAEAFEKSEGGGSGRDAQKRVDNELPALLNDVRSGRFVDAVTKGAKMLSYGELAKPQIAMIHKQLVEAYVALDAPGLAGASCRAWRELDPGVELDPTYYSPKILDACELGARGR